MVKLVDLPRIFLGQVVELVDTQRSGRCDRKIVQVQLLSCPPEIVRGTQSQHQSAFGETVRDKLFRTL